MLKKFCLVLNMILMISIKICALEQDQDAESKSRLEIINLLQKWPQDFNSKNSQGICRLFAPDLVASYQGVADRNYEEICRQLTFASTHPDILFQYEAPKIEQILIEGDMAVVRLTWTLKMSNKQESITETVKEKGIDVFKRQKDGSWKIAISYAYPETK